MIRHQIGIAGGVEAGTGPVSELRVMVEGGEKPALNYKFLTGPVEPGDRLLLNTTALHLGLGSGGFHIVMHNFSRPLPAFGGRGHIMKLCYSPWQLRVLSCEEEAAGHRPQLARFAGLGETPVLIGELHSMVGPAVAVLKYYRPACRVAYVMTDETALPLAFSRNIARLQEKGLLSGTVTCGHAFGGALEAVNVYSALAACRSLLEADFIILGPGPGSIGTASRLGFSGMETGDHVNRVNALGGAPVYIPRISFAERRRRHFGVSHHTLTALAVAALSPALLVLPQMPAPRLRLCLSQLYRRGLPARHRLQVLKAPPLPEIMERAGCGPLESMGRRYREDPYFFDAAAAAAAAALRMVSEKERRGEIGGTGEQEKAYRRGNRGERGATGEREKGERRTKTMGAGRLVRLSLPGPDY